jgi:hypothetical protein
MFARENYILLLSMHGSMSKYTGYMVSLVHVAMTKVPLDACFCPERWWHVSNTMLKNVTSVVHTNKLQIIQLLEADLNQVLRSAFSRNISKLALGHDGTMSEHQYGISHRTCISHISSHFKFSFKNEQIT